MKAVRFSRFGGPQVLEIVDLPDPHPEPGQVRIAVRAAGLNASDWKKRQGLMDQELPQTLGHEAAGVVDELGEGVTDVRFSRGDAGRALYILTAIGDLIESGRSSLRVGQTYPLADVAEAQQASEQGRVRGKIVLTVD